MNDYLKEEIQAESLTRNLPAFSRFLQSAAITNGMLLNYSNAARDSGVSVKTIRSYYEILEDTLLGRLLEPWKKQKNRKLIETAKFYFFDLGIVSALLKQNTLLPETPQYGRAFEHFIIQECWAHKHYSGKDYSMCFYKTKSGSEVDLILGDAEIAIEIKSSSHVSDKAKGLKIFQSEHSCKQAYIVSREPFPRKVDKHITILPWKTFFEMLWDGEII